MTEDRQPSECGSYFAPPGRATPMVVSEQASFCLDDPIVRAVLEAVDSHAVVLNAQRQIIAANPRLLQALSGEPTGSCQGLRLGEILGCVRAGEGPDGCGTSQACRRCGALLSILTTQETGQSSTGECLISMLREGRRTAREFAVHALPLTVAGHQLTLLTLQDIGAQKRRDALERIFIHDLHGSLQELRGWTETLQAAGAEATVVAEKILALAGQLTAEVASQSRLLQAERGELVTTFRQISPEVVLDELERSLGAEVMPQLIRLPPPLELTLLQTDPEILCWILNSMVRNAVEALPMGGQARIWHERRPGYLIFVVQNPGCMPPEVAERVFLRSFSTKAEHGRGLGTYGMKLFGETVLGGKVGFTTSWAEGTQFFIELPAGD